MASHQNIPATNYAEQPTAIMDELTTSDQGTSTTLIAQDTATADQNLDSEEGVQLPFPLASLTMMPYGFTSSGAYIGPLPGTQSTFLAPNTPYDYFTTHLTEVPEPSAAIIQSSIDVATAPPPSSTPVWIDHPPHLDIESPWLNNSTFEPNQGDGGATEISQPLPADPTPTAVQAPQQVVSDTPNFSNGETGLPDIVPVITMGDDMTLIAQFWGHHFAAWEAHVGTPTRRQPHSLAEILGFMESLPEVPLSELDDNDKVCRICWGAYEIDVSLVEGKLEKAVR